MRYAMVLGITVLCSLSCVHGGTGTTQEVSTSVSARQAPASPPPPPVCAPPADWSANNMKEDKPVPAGAEQPIFVTLPTGAQWSRRMLRAENPAEGTWSDCPSIGLCDPPRTDVQVIERDDGLPTIGFKVRNEANVARRMCLNVEYQP